MNGSLTLIECDFFLCAAAIDGSIGRFIFDEEVFALAISLANNKLKSFGTIVLRLRRVFGFTDLNLFFVTLYLASYIIPESYSYGFNYAYLAVAFPESSIGIGSQSSCVFESSFDVGVAPAAFSKNFPGLLYVFANF